MKKIYRFLPLLFIIDACVDPLQFQLPTGLGSIVFDGQITDDPGPYSVKIFYAGPFDGISLQQSVPERGAVVRIMSDAGESIQLFETSPGTYQTNPSSLQGVPGRSYSLYVKTKSGKEYSAAPQKMAASGQIDNLYVAFEKNSVVLNNSTQPTDAFSIYVDAHGEQESNLYRWRWANTFKAESHPELHVIVTRDGPIPDPLPCSGYIANGPGISKVRDCTCCICWATEYNSNAVISENKFAKDQSFQKVLLAKLPVTADRFYERYYISVDQLSVSPEVYEFWKLAEALQKSTGSLFQPNSVKVRGNVSCTNQPADEVLGIFEVSAITKRTLAITRGQVPFDVPQLEAIQYDCRESFINATTQKPPFW